MDKKIGLLISLALSYSLPLENIHTLSEGQS
jgi:hypothetical protein